MKNLKMTALFCFMLMGTFLLATTYHVGVDGSDSNAGLSWAESYRTITKGLESAASGDEVWVAQGVYTEGETLEVSKGVSLRGGFAGNESELSQREAHRNRTEINGDYSYNCISNAGYVEYFDIAKGLQGVYNNEYAKLFACNIYYCTAAYAVRCAKGAQVSKCSIHHNMESGVSLLPNACLRKSEIYCNEDHGVNSYQGQTTNCQIYCNERGGIAGGTITNCTVVYNGNNSTSSYGISNGKVLNTISYYNSPAEYDIKTDTNTYNSCYSNAREENNNISHAPSFLKTSHKYYQMDLHLKENSPGIGIGKTDALTVPLDDFDGNMRMEPESQTLQIDAGAFEWIPGKTIPSFYSNTTTGNKEYSFHFSDQSIGNIESWAWDFDNDGITDSNDQNPSHQYSTPGRYTVCLSVTDDSGKSFSIQKKDYIHVYTGYFVKKNGSDSASGRDWDSAFGTIHRALSISGKKDYIWVQEGIYKEKKRLYIPEDVSLYGGFKGTETSFSERSVEAHPTIVDGENQYECFLNKGILNGFSITNGYSNSSVIKNQGTVSRCKIYNNTCKDNYHGVLYNSGNVQYSEIFNNTGTGAGIYNQNGTIRYCQVYGNVCSGEFSGGIHHSSGLVSRCHIFENTGKKGGGVYSYRGILSDCVIEKNTAPKGAGIYLEKQESQLINSTVVYNNGTGIDSQGEVINTISWFNSEDIILSGRGSASHCCYPSADSANGNIFDQPQFLGKRFSQNEYDYHLPSNSPCVNAGTTGENVSNYDREGVRRVGQPDIGAYEYSGARLRPLFYSNSKKCAAPVQIQFYDDSTGSPVSWEWDFDNDGTIDSTEQNPKHTFLSAGSYTVYFSIKNASGLRESRTFENCIQIGQTYFVKPQGNNNANGLSWDQAFQSIVHALELSEPNDSIFVHSGNYAEGQTITVPANVSLYGGFSEIESTPQERTIDNKSRSNLIGGDFITVNNEGILDGFDLTNSLYMALDNNAGLIENCRFYSNMCDYGYSGIFYNRAYGKIYKCRFYNNTSTSSSRISNGAEIRSCFFYSNRSNKTLIASSGKIINSVLYNNESNDHLISNGTLSHCTIYGNNSAQRAVSMVYGTNIVENCIIWSNGNGDLSVNTQNESCSINSSCYSEATSGNGNICIEPAFIHTLGDPSTWDLHLLENSPCMDSCINHIDSIETDLEDNPRNIGNKPDMGAYEYHSPKVLFVCDQTFGNGPLSVQFTDCSQGDISGWKWDFDSDGSWDSTEQNPQYTYTASGQFTVTLQATFSDGTQLELQKIDLIHVAMRIFVSEAGNDANSGKSWNEAFRTLYQALFQASSYDEIWVQKGFYQEKAVLCIPEEVSVYGSFNGNEEELSERQLTSDKTIFSGNYTHTCFLNFGLIDGVNVIHGKSTYKGGGIYNARSGIIRNCVIEGCEAYSGGGIYNFGLIEKSTIKNNSCTQSGAGIYNHGEISKSKVFGNFSKNSAGGIYQQTGQTVNTLIYRNTASYYGGIYLRGTAIHCTISENRETKSGSTSPYGTIYNSIIWNNYPDELNSSYRVYNSCYSGAADINGNIDSDPLFQNALDENISLLDFRLQASSPCINTALSESEDISLPESDLEGLSCPSGNGYDMGAYEFQEIDLKSDFSVNKRNGIFNLQVQFQDHSTGSPVSWQWDFDGDHEIDSTEQNPVFIYDLAGKYTVSLTVKDAQENTHTCEKNEYISVGTRIYVSPNGSDDNSGLSWEEPYRSITKALVAVPEYSEIWVEKGEFLEGKTIYVPANTSLYGGFSGIEESIDQRSGIDYSIINGKRKYKCIENSGLVESFSITNGYSELETGGIDNNISGKIRHCQIYGNTSLKSCAAVYNRGTLQKSQVYQNLQLGNSGRGGAIINEAVISDCSIFNNRAEKIIGAGVYLHNGSKIINCKIYNNRSTKDGVQISGNTDSVILNCTIAGPLNASPTGVYTAGDVINSIIWGHSEKATINGTIKHSCVQNYTFTNTEDQNINEDPCFVQMPGSGFAGDLHLKENSPCVDAGLSSDISLPSTDIDGYGRITGDDVDMGAYEYSESDLRASFYSDTDSIRPGETMAFFDTSSGNPTGWKWDFDGNGTVDSEDQNPTFTFSESGYYPVCLTVYNDQGQSNIYSMGVYIGQTYYVSLEGKDIFGGRSWEKAYQSIRFALDRSFSGDSLWIKTGDYNMPTIEIPYKVGIYGGFAGNEILLQERDVENNPTVLINATFGYITNAGIIDGLELTKDYYINYAHESIKNLSNGIIKNSKIYHYRYGKNGAIHNQGTIINCELFDNSCGIENSGAVFDCLFYDNNGNAIKNSGEVENCTFYSNSGVNGGAIDNSGTVSESVFYENQGQNGGAVYNQGVLNNCLIYANNASREGGGVYNQGNIIHCTIADNKSEKLSDGVYNESEGKIYNSIIYYHENCSIQNNTSLVYSSCAPELQQGVNGNTCFFPAFKNINGASTDWDFHLKNGSPCIDNGSLDYATLLDLEGNERPGTDQLVCMGAYESQDSYIPTESETPAILYVSKSGSDQDGLSWATAYTTIDAAINNSSIDKNRAFSIWIQAGEYTCSSLVIPGYVSLYGGFQGNETELNQRNTREYKVNVSGNDQNSLSIIGILDGIYLTRWNSIQNAGILKKSFLSENSCTFVNSGLLEYSVLTNNSIEFENRERGIISHCRFINNVSRVRFLMNRGSLENSLLYGNRGYYHNKLIDNYGQIQSSTIVNPIHCNQRSGIMNGGEVLNSIIWGFQKNIENDKNGSISYSCFPESDQSGNNISEDPAFTISLNLNNSPIYRLTADSPCIDAGYIPSDNEPCDDIESTPRPIGISFDMGCYEYSSEYLFADFSVNKIMGSAPCKVEFSDYSSEQASEWSWDFDDDGTIDSTDQNPSYIYTQPGNYTVILTVSNGNGEFRSVRKESLIQICNRYYIAENGNDNNDGLSWNSAKKTLANVLDDADENTHVWISQGQYSAVPDHIILEQQAVIGGFAGNETYLEERPMDNYDTIIDGQNLTIFLKENHGLLDGLSFTYGTVKEGALLDNRNEGTINNCCLYRNRTGNSDAHVLRSYGVIESCKIYDNETEGNHSIIYSEGIINNSSIYNNTNYSAGGTIDNDYGYILNSQIHDNHSKSAGGISSSRGKIQNCLIYNNEASEYGGGITAYDTEISHCSVYNNYANERGGISAYLGSINNSTIYKNYSVSDASAVYLNRTVFRGSKVYGNYLIASGSVIHIVGGSMHNVLVYRNTAHSENSFALMAEEAYSNNQPIISYCSIVGNDCSPLNMNSGEIYNSIFWNNKEEPDLSSVTSDGIFMDDPLFVNCSESIKDWDLHLQASSPCIDSGIAIDPDAVETDLDGNDRIIGESADPGAYEASVDTLKPLFAYTHNSENKFEVSFTDHSYGSPVAWSWDFDQDGEEDSTLQNPVHVFSSEGFFPVSLTVSDSIGNQLKVTQTIEFIPSLSRIYVANNGDNSNTGESWDQAFASIEKALVRAEENVEIWVAGEYSLNCAFYIPEKISLIGGFKGNEHAKDERDLLENKTLLLMDKVQFSLMNYGYMEGFHCLNSSQEVDGAALQNYGTTAHCSFSNCHSTGSGGAVWNAGTISECSFYQNSADGYGGAVYNNGGTIAKSCIYNNYASGNGGGIYNEGGTIEKSRVYCNESNYKGAGIYNNQGCISNSLIYANTTWLEGLGVYNDHGEVIHCTVSGNTSDSTGPGTRNAGLRNQYGTVKNTIVWNNDMTDIESYQGEIYASCYKEAAENDENQNINLDPCFVNTEGDSRCMDLHLGAGSPCIGQANMEYSIEHDIDGYSRLQGTSSDMGAYEYQEELLQPIFYAKQKTVAKNSSVQLFNASRGNPVSWSWDLYLDGSVDSTEENPIFTLDQIGPVSISLMITNDQGETKTLIKNNYLEVYDRCYVALSGDASNDGLSWQTALPSISLALDKVQGAGEFWVACGVYMEEDTITISRDQHVYGGFSGNETMLDQRSKTAEAQTIIDGQNDHMCVYNAGSLEGFSIRNGTSLWHAGGVFNDRYGTISNCRIFENKKSRGLMNLGKASNLHVYNNTSPYGGTGIKNNGCGIVENSYIYNNETEGVGKGAGIYQEAYAVTRNCRVFSNTTHSTADNIGYGAGIYNISQNAIIENCLIYNNKIEGESGRGGGVYNGGIILYSTIAYNEAKTGAQCECEYYSFMVYSSIFWGDSSSNFYSRQNRNIHNCCMKEFYGSYTVRSNPKFQHVAGPPESWDFHLQSDSPCIDQGETIHSTFPDDLDGNPRPEGDRVDIGCYEYIESTEVREVLFSADVTEGPAPLSVSFNDHSIGSPTAWEWDFNGDGVTDRTEQNPTYTYEKGGTFDVSLSITYSDSSSEALTKPSYIQVAGCRYYVSNSSNSMNNNGLSWESPMKSITQALYFAKTGDEIWVKAGIYSEGKTLVIPEGIFVYGGFSGTETELSDRNNRQASIIDGESRYCCIDNNGILDSFSIRNGRYWETEIGGINNNGILRNCLVYQNHDIAINNEGTVLNCTVFRNTYLDNSGNIIGGIGIQNHGLVINSISWDNGIYDIAYGGLIYHSCYSESTWVNGNIPLNPLFKNTNGESEHWDLALRETSPCINNGIFYYHLSAYDFTGNPRIINGTVDMGAYELFEATVSDFDADPLTGFAPLEVTFSDKSSADVTEWAWDFDNDGTVDSTLQNPVYTYDSPGLYSVSLTVTSELGENTALKQNLIYVGNNDAPDLDAEFVSSTIPSTLEPGKEYSFTVSFRNTGKTEWLQNDLIKLGALGDSDPFSPSLRYFVEEDTPLGSVADFHMILSTNEEGVFTTDWMMLKEGVAWFGEAFSHDVLVEKKTAVPAIGWTLYQ